MDAKLMEMKENVDLETLDARRAAQYSEKELKDARDESQRMKTAMTTLKAEAEDREEELVTQLEQHRLLISRVAEEYGRLASSSVPL